MLSTDTILSQASSPIARELIETPFAKLGCLSSVEEFEFVRDFEVEAKRILQDLEAKDASPSRDRSTPRRRIRRKKKRRKNKRGNGRREKRSAEKRVRTHSMAGEAASNFWRDPYAASDRRGNSTSSGIFRIEGLQTQKREGSQTFGKAESQFHRQRKGRSVAKLPSGAQSQDFEGGEARTFPDVVCRQSNTGLFSFFAFAILSLDLTANIMSTIDISVDIDIAGSAANSSTTINNTNTNTNTNDNMNMNTNNNGRSLYSFDLQTSSSNPGGVGESARTSSNPGGVGESARTSEDSGGVGESARTSEDSGGVGESARTSEDSGGVGESARTSEDSGDADYVTGEAGYPPQVTVGEENSLKELLENAYGRFLEVHQRIITEQGRVHRRGFSQGFLQAWFEVVLDLYYALRE